MSIFSTKDWDRGKSPLQMEKRPVTLIPPIRLKILDVEKALQAECKRDRRLQNGQKLQLTLDLLKSSTRLNWLPLFDSHHQEYDPGKEDKNDSLDHHHLNRISLKRLQPTSLFETSSRKLQKTAHDDMEIVLDKQLYLPLFQQSQKWCRRDSTSSDQEVDKSLTVSMQSSIQSPNENQPQSQQPQLHKQQQEQQQQQLTLEQQEQQVTIDILEEVLGETDYNARSRIIVPTMKKRGSLSSSTSTRPLPNAIPPTPKSHPPTPSSEPLTSIEARSVAATETPVPAAASTTTTTKITTTESPVSVATTAASLASAVSATTMSSSSTESRPASLPLTTSSPRSKSLTTTGTRTTDTSLPSHAGSQLDSIPRQNIPVFGTSLQCQAVKKEISRLASFSTSLLKHHIGKVMDILNHPLIALIPEYFESDESLWHGSGKTLLLQQLLTRLEERTQVFHLAIVCYDLNAEEFLMKLIKPRFKVQRLNTVKDDEWDQEYGVIVRIKKPQSISPKPTFDVKVDLAIIMDIRVQPTDPVMTMFQNTTSSGPPPIVSLVTNRSVELRMQDYISKSSSQRKWRIPDPTTCASIFDTKNDTAVENGGLLTFMVVDSVIRWIDSGMKTEYQFANNNQNATSLQMDTDHQSSTLPPHSSRSHQQQSITKTTEWPADQGRSRRPETTTHAIANTAIAEPTKDAATPSLQDDLTKLFSHVSLERLQNDLKSYKSSHGKSSSQHNTARSDDEDSFYSAKSDSLSDDNTSYKVQAVIDSLQDTFGDIGETAQPADMLKSMKAEFDKKCLTTFQAMVASYQKSVMELQNEYATEAEKKLGLPSACTGTDSSSS